MREIANLVVGLGVTGRAVAHALLVRGYEVVAVEDFPTETTRSFAMAGGIELFESPSTEEVTELVARTQRVLPSPGIPDAHPAMLSARSMGKTIRSEFDLAQEWDSRPVAAVTGTNGKTTVTTLVTAMLNASGIRASAVGNTEVPYIAAINDQSCQAFVVEASSFRLGHSHHFLPHVATWLNFSPDHLDVHGSLASYETAKAQIFRWQVASDIAIYNPADPVVVKHLGAARAISFGLENADYHVANGFLRGPDGEEILAVAELKRHLPHDLLNALAAVATAKAMGANPSAIAQSLREFSGLDHRMQLVAVHAGVQFYNDSKATVPEAVAVATSGLPSIVLIAGGKNKGLSYNALVKHAHHLKAVVAIGEAASTVVELMTAHNIAVQTAASMEEAVASAYQLATPGDAVLLSPGGTSHDWYQNYEERGDHFVECVTNLMSRATGDETSSNANGEDRP